MTGVAERLQRVVAVGGLVPAGVVPTGPASSGAVLLHCDLGAQDRRVDGTLRTTRCVEGWGTILQGQSAEGVHNKMDDPTPSRRETTAVQETLGLLGPEFSPSYAPSGGGRSATRTPRPWPVTVWDGRVRTPGSTIPANSLPPPHSRSKGLSALSLEAGVGLVRTPWYGSSLLR